MLIKVHGDQQWIIQYSFKEVGELLWGGAGKALSLKMKRHGTGASWEDLRLQAGRREGGERECEQAPGDALQEWPWGLPPQHMALAKS